MNKKKIYRFISFLFFLSLNSCTNPNTSIFGCASVTSNPSVSFINLSSSSEIAEIAGKKFELEIPYEVSRNTGQGAVSSVPFISNTGDCLSLTINVISKETNSRLPLNYKVEKFWLINGNEAWETNLDSFSTQYPMVIHGGPKWDGTGLYSVIKIVDNTGKSYFIKSKKFDIIGII